MTSYEHVMPNGEKVHLYAIAENIIRCVYTKGDAQKTESKLNINPVISTKLQIYEKEDRIEIATDSVKLKINRETGWFVWSKTKTDQVLLREGNKELKELPLVEYTTGDEKPEIHRVVTVDGERNFIKNLKPVEVGKAYTGKLHFKWKDKEQIHGLGQGEEGIYDYRGKMQYLYQHNMRIPMPFFVSNAGYGILFDCGSLMTFHDDIHGSYVYLDCISQLDYYFIAGENIDEVIKGYRRLTGKANMLPKWAYGYVQSKEAYHTQKEIVETAKEYRKRNIPLDCIVQDWDTWEKGKWGNKIVDKKRYPDVKAMNDELHEMHVHSMVSVWPNMNTGTENYKEMEEKGLLLGDYATYDAFLEEGRKTYWKQANAELFQGGFDSWWCDSTEPFSGPDWNGEYLREPWERFHIVGEEHKKFLRADRANLYALAHAKGIYENQRKETNEKRVLNLTRSGYASIQKYSAVLWSGDITASWETLQKQIVEGLNTCMSGIPYWTLDIGGFFTVHKKWQNRGCFCNHDSEMKWFWKGDFDEGINNPGYRELYTRWLQFGVFLPMFRSHGTDTPREVWNFGEQGSVFYDAIVDAIRLRYRLMPYIYSMAGGVWQRDETMMRSLLFDFSEDEEAAFIHSQFMFGKNIMVCPVTEPMYYDKNGEKINCRREKNCYLPKGYIWHDFYTNACYKGGSWVTIPVTMQSIPVFIKGGSILPMEENLDYAAQAVESPLQLHIYTGADTEFIYYEDEGDSYQYEDGVYNNILLIWKNTKKELHIKNATKSLKGSIVGRTIQLILDGQIKKEIIYKGKEMVICL